MSTRRPSAMLSLMAVLALPAMPTSPLRAATPPSLVNYQGVLRDQNDKPLTGTYDVTFRFFSDAIAGDEIMIDQHAAATMNAVTVAGGVFDVALGSGTVTDGSGSGTYTSLDQVFRDYGSVWLEVTVGGETLSPRTPIRSAPYALNATQLGGQPAGSFIDTSTTQQAKNGRLNVFNTDYGGYALVGQEQGGVGTGIYGFGAFLGVQGVGGDAGYGGSFSAGAYGVTGDATTGTGGLFTGGYLGVHALGGSVYASGAAGLFEGQGFSKGIIARAPDGAGRFEATSSYAPSADLALGSTGVTGSCTTYGGTGLSGFGERAGVRGYASGANAGGATGGRFSADGALSVGVSGSGVTGGVFATTADPTLTVNLADPTRGVNASGGAYAGYFSTTAAGSTGVYASGTTNGVQGSGQSYGGYFSGLGSSTVGVYGTGGTGVRGHGTALGGGSFDSTSGASATIATSGGLGISASGTTAGSYFADGAPWYSYAYVPYYDLGVLAYGANIGAQLFNFASGAWADVSYSSYKIYGVGSVSFVQNHPTDPSKVIVYAAPEGDEVAVYTRGSGRLTNGEARVPLGETFALVANPDIGLTATVTPIGDPVPLAVASKSTSEIVVRGPAGSSAEFDYVVWGLRIGFEEQSIVQPKDKDAKIPSMHQHDEFFSTDPSLRRYTALARFEGVEASLHGTKAPDLSRAARLRDAVGVFPYRVPGPEMQPAAERSDPPAAPPDTAVGARQAAPAGIDAAHAVSTPVAAVAPVATPAALELPVTEPVEAGDLLVLDPLAPGELRKSASSGDPNVAGIATGPSVERGDDLVAPVATGTYALVRADAQFGAIEPGDLLVSSATPGHAMVSKAPAPGTVLGKALQPLDSGTGLIRVLLIAR